MTVCLYTECARTSTHFYRCVHERQHDVPTFIIVLSLEHLLRLSPASRLLVTVAVVVVRSSFFVFGKKLQKDRKKTHTVPCVFRFISVRRPNRFGIFFPSRFTPSAADTVENNNYVVVTNDVCARCPKPVDFTVDLSFTLRYFNTN